MAHPSTSSSPISRCQGGDGIELADALAAELPQAPPVIILSTAASRESARGRSTKHVSRFLTKPARRSQLLDAIAGALRAAPQSALVELPIPKRTATTARGSRILVVDDNAMNQRLATLLLEKVGYDVDVVENGAEAVAAVRCGGYRAVLMDCEMPVMDGYTATAEIRRLQTPNARIPIIAVTASAMTGDAQRALAAGMDAHVTKPIDRHELYRVIAALLDSRSRVVDPSVTAGEGSGDFDQRSLDMLVELDDTGEALRDLVALFVRDNPPRVDALQAATDTSDLQAVRTIAHSIKGPAATMGARTLHRLCHAIESNGRAGTLPDADDLTAVRRALDETIAHLQAVASRTVADSESGLRTPHSSLPRARWCARACIRPSRMTPRTPKDPWSRSTNLTNPFADPLSKRLALTDQYGASSIVGNRVPDTRRTTVGN